MPPIQYLALGDSYTIGESVVNHERWSNQLASLIESSPEFFGRRVDVSVIAKTGWTTQELWEGIQGRQLQPPYDLISLLIGVNNQYRGRDIAEYRQQFQELLVRSIVFAGGEADHVIVISIPDWGVTPFAGASDSIKLADEIDAFNAVNREEAKRAGARYINVTEISRLAAEDPTLLARDNLHPSGKMYRMWVDVILPEALAVFQKTSGG